MRGLLAQEEVEAIIDTGFNGILTLPPPLIATLDLPFHRRGRVILADGSESFFDVHEATVIWDERPRRVAVGATDAKPLIGMSLLNGYELTVQVVDGGSVFIRALT